MAQWMVCHIIKDCCQSIKECEAELYLANTDDEAGELVTLFHTLAGPTDGGYPNEAFAIRISDIPNALDAIIACRAQLELEEGETADV